MPARRDRSAIHTGRSHYAEIIRYIWFRTIHIPHLAPLLEAGDATHRKLA
ncbi:hypothetical protein FDG2_6055 [Candidatus Protofrankia californiensis]|uniref:Uncharacterized protein n=1 Tax=Candidatus Protofrankia californiensis TaxID=1839754 RepID=A0A1C3PGB8_9ACTN|nr:hypothetical protein FDG2_6055 [Candidatus Protofrankia californiensis]